MDKKLSKKSVRRTWKKHTSQNWESSKQLNKNFNSLLQKYYFPAIIIQSKTTSNFCHNFPKCDKLKSPQNLRGTIQSFVKLFSLW